MNIFVQIYATQWNHPCSSAKIPPHLVNPFAKSAAESLPNVPSAAGDASELARRASVSRTTLHNLQNGATRRPRAATLVRIAEALDLPPETLTDSLGDNPPVNAWGANSAAALQFDRDTNRCVKEVYGRRPRLFAGWTDDEWNELYSTFGTGGQLAPQGVEAMAEKINARRETVRQLHVLMETHLADVATDLIDTLYRQVRPQSNLAATPELAALLAEHQLKSQPYSTAATPTHSVDVQECSESSSATI